MQKVVERPKIKSQWFKGVINPSPTNGKGLVRSFARVKTNGEVNRTIPNDVLPSLEETVFVDGHSQSKKKMQKWLQEHILDFIKMGDWLSSSPDLKPRSHLRMKSCECALITNVNGYSSVCSVIRHSRTTENKS